MQKHILVLVLMFVAMSSSVWADCGKLCDWDWWKTATAADLQALLDAGADVNTRTEGGATPLHSAAGWGTAEGVQLLIAAGADVSARSEGGYTPLHWAKTAESIQLLIAAGADVSARSENGRTALHSAAWLGTAETIEALIAAGADVSVRDEDGTKPLIIAAKFNKTETVQLLIAAGADVSARDERGYTPLLWAAWMGTAETIEALIAAGADITAKAEYGRSVWDLAQTNEKLAGTEALWLLAAALGKCGGLCNKTWWETATAADLQALLDAGADVNTRTEGGATPLHSAAGWGTAESIQLLIAAGANLNTRTEDGTTPLHSAAANGTAEMVRLLWAAGADITAKDDSGTSVWDLAQTNEKLAGTEARWSLAEALGKCSRWCDVLWWKQTTAADLQALLDAGVYNKLSKKDQKTAWNLAKSSPLKGSEVYWALNEARFK